MSISTRILAGSALAALLAGCAGGSGVAPVGPATQSNHQAVQSSFKGFPHGRVPIDAARMGAPAMRGPQLTLKNPPPPALKPAGLYVGEFWADFVSGFQANNYANSPAVCTLPAGYVNGAQGDSAGYLYLPNGYDPITYSSDVIVYDKSKNVLDTCAKEDGSPILDSGGQAADAVATGGPNGTIYVGEIANYTTGAGDVAVCSLSGGCTANLQNSTITAYAAGVTEDSSGNVYLSGDTGSPSAPGAPVLVEFAGGTGSGTVLNGYVNKGYGGLMFDKRGNLLSIDVTADAVNVYGGCSTGTCSKISSLALTNSGGAIYGSLNKANTLLAIGDYINGTVDVYKLKYSVKKGYGLAYDYSVSNGLAGSEDVEAAVLELGFE
jgi:hypothetical protein